LTQELARLRGEPVYGLVTSDTAAPLPRALERSAICQLAPGETAGSVGRFLDHWRPDVAIVLGPPDRPHLLAEARSRDIPLYLAASARGQMAPGGKLAYLSATLLDAFEAFLVPSVAEAQAFYRQEIDPKRVHVTGPLSDTALALACNKMEYDAFVKELAGRPIWLAAQISDDEVPIVETAFRRTIRAAHRLLLIVVPRNPASGTGIARTLTDQGWRVALRSAEEDPDETTQIFVADTDDEMGLWYRLAPISFLGGSLDSTSTSTDPFEAAALGSAIVHGPNIGAAGARIQRLITAGATVEIQTGDALGDAVFRLLSPDKAAELAHAGWAVTSESAHVVEKLAEIIDTMLDDRMTR
jgi:3-deoxy-D-manno-octulosonic-acid transferase